MAVKDTPPPPSFPTDKIIPFSIPNKVLIKLDLKKHNYNSWRSFSLIHLGSLGLKAHVETDTASNAKAIWDHLKDLFHDNKDARAINLDSELHSLKIGKILINEYCTKIKFMENRLKNLDCDVSEKNLVIYAVNGLDSRFATLVEIIRHHEPLPTFEIVCNMLLFKESSFTDSTDASTMLESSSSSPTILLASSSSDVKGTMAQPVPHQQLQPTSSAHQPVIYMAQQNSQVIPNQPNTNGNGILGPALVCYASQPTALPSAFITMLLQDPTWNMDTGANSHLNSNACNLSTLFNKRLFSSIHVGDGNSVPVTNTGHSIFPSYHRPLHLHNVLVTPNIIKNLIFVCQFTRNNNYTIEFDAFDFSVKDFLTRHILIRCDRSGDLCLVNKPSTLPAVFMSTSSTTWHQRLGHPGDKVLRSLSSRQFISCNKAKSTHVCHACQLDPNWYNAMYDKYDALVKNDTWIFILRPTDANRVRSMWLFKHKFHDDGMLSCYKALLVANGSSQQLGIDFDETFSPVVKPATIRMVLYLAPPGFVDSRYPNHVCLLQRSLYGLKQAPCAWFQRFTGYITRAGFSPSRCDSSLFIYTQGFQVAYLLIYVDDIILTASSPALLQQIIDSLHKEFDMADLGELNYFLGFSVVLHPTRLFLSQKKYALQFLECAHIVNCNLSRTPVHTDSKLGLDGVPVQDPTLYRSLAGGLQYPTFTRLDLSYAGTLELGLHLYASATTSLVGYTDADWAGYPSTRSSTFGYCMFLATLVYCDNVSVVYISANPIQHQQTKHIKIDIHFVRNMVKPCHVRVLHVPSRYHYADIFTKGLPSALLEYFGSSLSARHPHV
nr:ribonuclease H-like domain-containing protein [Tanacetum cinerariifolium]